MVSKNKYVKSVIKGDVYLKKLLFDVDILDPRKLQFNGK